MSELAHVPIVEVIRALGGPDVQGGRTRAWWRDGDGLNVAVDVEKNRWYDHVANIGGGVLALVRMVTLTDDASALAWLVEHGFIEDRPMPKAGRRSDRVWGPVVAQYDYRDADGRLVYCVRRHDPKDFSQWRWTGTEWQSGIKGIPRLLYRLQELTEAAIVFIVEGERDVETLREWGFAATCNSGGAEHWPHQQDELFRGREVIILPDNDVKGMAHARDVAAGLLGKAARLSILILDGAKDITEWFERGHSEVELIHLIEQEAACAN